MRLGSLFAGIGGFDLAARWMGWTTAWYSEIEPYPSAVMAHHFPEAKALGDIRLIRWEEQEWVDLMCGGFPCQDLSVAGNRKGLAGERSGLWSEFARAIRDLRPRWVVIENVPPLLTGGFAVVRGDLRAAGYRVARPVLLSASAVGSPHLRERLWIVAHAEGEHRGLQLQPGRPLQAGVEPVGCREDVADTQEQPERAGLCESGTGGERWGRLGDSSSAKDVPDPGSAGLEVGRGTAGQRAHAAAPRGDWWATEPDVGRVAHGVPRRVDRLAGLGNAIVPACALVIFRAIQNAEERVAPA